MKPTSVIDPKASIGKGTVIGDACYIGSNVILGENNHIASHVVIDGHTTIGNNNTIGDHTVLGTAPQDIKSTSDNIGLSIGSHNTIGSRVFITAGTEHGGMMTRIGDHNQMGNGIHIGHDVQLGSHCLMEEDAALGGHVVVGDHVSFGSDTAVHQFVEIGSHACLTAGAALTQDLPPCCSAEGNRAKITRLHQETLEKHFSTEEQSAIQEAYSGLFSALSPKEHAEQALEKETVGIVQEFYRFIVGSKRGIPFKRKTNAN